MKRFLATAAFAAGTIALLGAGGNQADSGDHTGHEQVRD
jgi:hypothetical protein